MKRLKIYTVIVLSLILFKINVIAQTGLYINEVLPFNLSTNYDTDFWEYSDWIEIYNSSNIPIDLSDYFLSDKLNNLMKWSFPDGTVINAHEYLLIWADNKNSDLHTNFRLKNKGETLFLVDGSYTIIDSLRFEAVYPDVSYGKTNDGNKFFVQPSPKMENLNFVSEEQLLPPIFSSEQGTYSSQISLTISSENTECKIRFTTDGSFPDINTKIYEGQIELNATTVVRARCFKGNDAIPSDVVTMTYFIDEFSNKLPVISIATNPKNLWDDSIGIHVQGVNGIKDFGPEHDPPRNWNCDWERPAYFEYFNKDGKHEFSTNVGIKIFGGWSRLKGQKSFSVFFRNRYSYNDFRYPFFSDKKVDKFKSIVLRNSGNDWELTMLRDAMMQTLIEGRMDVDYQRYAPAAVYLNGEYWGILNIREKLNEEYFESYHSVDADSIIILEDDAEVVEGDADEWNELLDFLNANSLENIDNYTYIKSKIDIDEYINYQITQIYVDNNDWPGNNLKYWKPEGYGKWRWVLFDLDFGFSYYKNFTFNTLAYAMDTDADGFSNPLWSTFLFRKLLESKEFKNEFIQRFAANLNFTFNSQRVNAIIDSLYGNVEAEIPNHADRWKNECYEFYSKTICGLASSNKWDDNLYSVYTFADNRANRVFGHLKNEFSLQDPLLHTFTVLGCGSIIANKVEILGNNVDGKFFSEMPLILEAIPYDGFQFVKWSGDLDSHDKYLTEQFSSEAAIEAIFEESDPDTKLYFNEFMASNNNTIADEYGEFDDWIELYNNGSEPIDIGGYYVTDDLSNLTKYKISSSNSSLTTIQPGGFLLLWADKDTEQGILHLNFKLSSSGEQLGLVRIVGSDTVIVDYLNFDFQETDVSRGRYPDASYFYYEMHSSTPKSSNVQDTKTKDIELIINSIEVYPNPTSSLINISINNQQGISNYQIMLYDLTGKLLIKEHFTKDLNSIDISSVPNGMYFLSIIENDNRTVKKIIKQDL